MKHDNESGNMAAPDITPVDAGPDLPAASVEEQPADTAPDLSPASDETVYTARQIDEMMAEAEERGYIRGRNERITALMMRPELLENPLRPREAPSRPSAGELAEAFLSSLRPSVWD